MLRGEAMQEYFAKHCEEPQADFFNAVLKMSAKPGVYPPGTSAIRRPMDCGPCVPSDDES